MCVRFPLKEIALVSRHSAAAKHPTSTEFGGKWGAECLNTRLNLSTLLLVGYSIKLKTNECGGTGTRTCWKPSTLIPIKPYVLIDQYFLSFTTKYITKIVCSDFRRTLNLFTKNECKC